MKTIRFGDYPRDQLIFGYIDPANGQVHKQFVPQAMNLGIRELLRQKALAQFPPNTPVEARSFERLNLSRYLNDCIASLTVQLGAIRNPPREMLTKLPVVDRLVILARQIQTKCQTLDFVARCAQGHDASGVVPIDDLEIQIPDEGDFAAEGGVWTYEGAFPEHGIQHDKFRLLTCQEDEEVSKRDLADEPSVAYQLSCCVLDHNGKGPLSEIDANQLDDLEAAALQELGPGREMGLDQSLDVGCKTCGTKGGTPSVTSVAAPFLFRPDPKGTPRFGGRSPG